MDSLSRELPLDALLLKTDRNLSIGAPFRPDGSVSSPADPRTPRLPGAAAVNDEMCPDARGSLSAAQEAVCACETYAGCLPAGRKSADAVQG